MARTDPIAMMPFRVVHRCLGAPCTDRMIARLCAPIIRLAIKLKVLHTSRSGLPIALLCALAFPSTRCPPAKIGCVQGAPIIGMVHFRAALIGCSVVGPALCTLLIYPRACRCSWGHPFIRTRNNITVYLWTISISIFVHGWCRTIILFRISCCPSAMPPLVVLKDSAL